MHLDSPGISKGQVEIALDDLLYIPLLGCVQPHADEFEARDLRPNVGSVALVEWEEGE